MKKYIFKRILHSLAVMFAVVTVVFVAMRSLPGGPARSALGEEASPEQVAALEEQLGLNDPLYIQYTDYMFDLIRLDFGTSIGTGQDVLTMLMLAGPRTFWIGIVGVIIGLSIAIPTGIISATRRNEPIDYVATVFAFTGLSMPAFFIGILLALVFGVWLGLLPIIGYNSFIAGWNCTLVPNNYTPGNSCWAALLRDCYEDDAIVVIGSSESTLYANCTCERTQQAG